MAASAERVTALAPEHRRGLITGLHGSAITVGAAVATPLAGLLIDLRSPGTAVLVIGSAGVVVALGAALLSGRGAWRSGLA